MFGANKEFDPQVLMTTMMGAVNEVFDKMCSEKFSDTPTTKTQEIYELELAKMDVDIILLQKFSTKCFISVINFFKNQKAQEKNKTCGFLIVYMKESCLIDLFRALGFQIVARDSSSLLDICGEFCNIIAGEFKKQLASIGYIDLFMSAPQSRMRSYKEGVDYPEGVKRYQELSFYLFNEKAVVVDVALANIPHT